MIMITTLSLIMLRARILSYHVHDQYHHGHDHDHRHADDHHLVVDYVKGENADGIDALLSPP